MAELSLGEALQAFLKKSRLKNGIMAVQIEDVWEKMMGKTIAKYTDKIQIIKGTLFISTNESTLRNTLMYQKEDIIKRVNETLGEQVIHEVVIR